MSTSEQLPLFTAQQPDRPIQVSAPSEEFDAAHPDFVQTTPDAARGGDVTLARRIRQTEAAGGGVASALRNRLPDEVIVEETAKDDEPTTSQEDDDEEQYTRDDVMAMVERLRDRNGTSPSTEEMAAQSRLVARHALNKLGR